MAEHARIIVVDDDEGIRKTLATILEEIGYVVDTVENGKEAIERSNAEFYNLALIDIRLPDMEGTKLLTAMKETTPEMIKIIMTGYPSIKHRQRPQHNQRTSHKTTRSKKIQRRKSHRIHQNTSKRA
jgi:DNA-binding NtrC family response regulator